MSEAKLTIFVSHPSHFLTDHLPHGDGLIAHSFLVRLARRGHKLHVASALCDLRAELPSSITLHPIKTLFRGTSGSQSFLHRVEYATEVRRLLNRIRKEYTIDIIHQLNPVVLGLSGLLYDLDIPLVMGPYWPSWGEVQENTRSLPKTLKGVLKAYTRKFCLQRCNALLSPTALSRKEILEAGVLPERVFPVNIGIDPEEFSPAPERPPAEPTILFLANPMLRKGIFDLVKAFELVCRSMPSAKLIIGGCGHQLKEVQDEAQKSANRHHIKFLGHVPRTDVPATLRACSVYCLPSYGEPFGMSALEAMACGKALVVTNTGGLNDLVRTQGGSKVQPGDVGALAKALEEILSDYSLQRQMGTFNRQLVLREYVWDQVLDRLEQVYRDLLMEKTLSGSQLRHTAGRQCL